MEVESINWGQAIIIVLTLAAFVWRVTSKLKDDLKKDLNRDIGRIEKAVGKIEELIRITREQLIKNGIVEPCTQASSLKKITERGHELLDKYEIKTYLNEKCPFLKSETIKEFSNKPDLDLFISCLNWVKEHGSTKVLGITLNEQVTESECNELVALAIMEKIKEFS